ELKDVAWLGWSDGGEPLAVCLKEAELRLHELAADRSRRFACAVQPYFLPPEGLCTCSPRGQTLAVAAADNTVRVWDVSTGRERCILRPEGRSARYLTLSPDGRILGSLSHTAAGYAVQLWDATTGEAQRTVATDQRYLERLA